MIELCYPAVVPRNELMNESHVEQMVQCINKLNKGIEYME